MQNYRLIIGFWACCLLLPLGLYGQASDGGVYVAPETDTASPDTVTVIPLTDGQDVLLLEADSVQQGEVAADTAAFRPDPEKVVWLGAIIPGYGQIVNKKYWQLPIVYGAYMGCAFAVTWFSSEYQFYKSAYRDMIDSDPTTNSHLEYLNNMGITLEQMGGEAAYRDRLKSFQDNYRRYRDYSILVSVGVYGLSILWAYVDAQLYDFDISPDLSLNISPTIIGGDVMYAKETNGYDAFGQSRVWGQNNAIGVQWRLRLK